VHGSDAAHDLHRLVLIHGRERARLMVPEKQRPLVDIAAEVMADESQRIGISYTGFCHSRRVAGRVHSGLAAPGLKAATSPGWRSILSTSPACSSSA